MTNPVRGEKARKTLGIVGGMGPWATHAFFGEVLSATVATCDQEHLHVIVDCDPQVPDRTAFLLGHGADPRPRIVAAGRRLAHAGADLLVMPCNTANVFAEELQQATGLPVVHWIDSAADAVAATGATAAGVLATTGTVTAGVYQEALKLRGIRPVLPSPIEQEAVMASVYGEGGAKSGRIAPERRRELLDTAALLCERGAEVVVLGCTELPLVVTADDDDWPCQAVDPAVIVARRVVALAGASPRLQLDKG